MNHHTRTKVLYYTYPYINAQTSLFKIRPQKRIIMSTITHNNAIPHTYDNDRWNISFLYVFEEINTDAQQHQPIPESSYHDTAKIQSTSKNMFA